MSALAVLFLLIPVMARAQEAVTLTGRVWAESRPVQGASVRIDALNVGTTTSADGRYSFIVPSSRVRGQTVAITVRHTRYRTQSAQVALVGGSLVQDFELSLAGPAPRSAEVIAATPAVRDAATRTAVRAPRVDSSAFVEAMGALDVPGALAGRLPGLEVQAAALPGGTSAVQVRGPRTIAGLAQPLYVVDGILVDDANVNAFGQRIGQGGFDYGSGIGDLNLADIESVELLRGPAAALRYGGRAANGVLLITTRDASRLNGLVVSASQQYSTASPLRLPEYQDAYGQGLAGQFSFFDGRGGGTNDAVAENWGPALLGQPIAQASLTEAGRPDVRFWTARPDNVRDYFDGGRTLATNVAAQGANATSHVRLSLTHRDITGLTPEATLTRQSAVLTAGMRPSSRLDVGATLQFHLGRANDRAGTGFDESNPVAVFSRMGRQVDVAALRTSLRDADSNQVSWNYAGSNNPWFAPLENSNDDRRTHLLGGVRAAYDFAPWLHGSARFGVDRVSDTRSFEVAEGWMGPFPWFGGSGAVVAGASQQDDVRARSMNGDVALRATRQAGSNVFALTVGAGRRSNLLQHDIVADGWPGTPLQVELGADAATDILHAGAEARIGDHSSVTAAASRETSSLLGNTASQLYPALLARVDVARLNPGLREAAGLDALELHGGWARSGNDVLPIALQQAGLLPAATEVSVLFDATPEVTSGWEAGASAAMFGRRLSADVTYYDERTTNVLASVQAGLAQPSRLTALSNSGIEARLQVVPFRAANGAEWRLDANLARNSSRVDLPATELDGLPLGSAFGGVSLRAVSGQPMASIVGTRFLRNAAGELLLRDGLPAADLAGGDQVLGSTAPDWFGGAGTSLRFGWVEAAILLDFRRGGRIFSVTNLVGATTGTLAETAFRPDSGLLIEGVDAATGNANTTHVSTEDYYHALAAIGERWVYDASVTRLREARLSVTLPLRAVRFFRAQSLRGSLVGRNLAMWAAAPNIDPETVLSSARFRGSEMGQHPSARSIGFQVTITP